jgi:hypothetical protein
MAAAGERGVGMRRVVNLWLALLAAFWLTRAGVSSLLFGRVDQSYQALVELLAVPALQAVALAWATRQGFLAPRMAAARWALPWREGWRLLPLRGALAIDAGVLLLAWLVPDAAGLPDWVLAAKLLAAAALLLAALGRPGWRGRDRLAFAATAAALLALAAETWRPWLAFLPTLLAPLAPGAAATARAAETVRWFGAYGSALAAALLLVLEAAAALRRHSRAAALAFDQALCLLLAAAGCAALGFVGQTAATGAAWARAATMLGSLSATALMVGSALAFRAHPVSAEAAERDLAEVPAAGGSGPPPPYRRPRRRLRPTGGPADEQASPPPVPGTGPGPGTGGGPSEEPA